MPNLPMHTPGPWKVTENRRERTIQIDSANGRGTVVQPHAISWRPDAVLIAQAPSTAALLDEAEKYCPVELQDRIRANRKAIHGPWVVPQAF
jgi:hypothetical protein